MQEPLFGSTHPGRIRSNNEDAFIAQAVPGQPFLVACVIDGVGGYEGGEVAAATARDTILSYLQQNKGNGVQLLRQAIVKANEAIWKIKEAKPEWEQMACVLTIALVDEKANNFHYAHVGDTRLYLFRDRSLVKITKDQSFVGFLEDSGRITEEEAMNHPKRNEINKAIGFEREIISKEDYLETGTSPFLPGDHLLLCSDGLTDMVPAAQIVSILQQQRSLPHTVEALIEAANEAGGKDNIAAVVVRNRQAPLVQTPIVPAKSTEQAIPEPVPPKEKRSRKRSKGPLLLLLCFCLIVVAGAWLVLREKKNAPEKVEVKQTMAAGLLLQSLQQDSGTITLSDSVYGRHVPVSDTITVRKDSLHVNGSGITLISNETFSGPALQLSVTKGILENMVFENFETAILVTEGKLELRNVQFKNCRVAVLYAYGTTSTTTLSGTFDFHNDDTSMARPKPQITQ